MERFLKINLELNNDLSAEDFQEKLYQWLEEQGILPGLRTYLRHQLISALKRTHLSSDYLNNKRNNSSLKDASFNLLIAEYLVQKNYQYTASIFYSEEPSLGKLPIQLKFQNEGEKPIKFFAENEVEEILESLNLVHSPTLFREVIDTYSKDPTSLLKAIVKTVAAQSKFFLLKKTELSQDAYSPKDGSTINRSEEQDQKASAEKISKLQIVEQQLGKSIAFDKEESLSPENKGNEVKSRVEDAIIEMRREMEREMAEQRKILEDGLMAKQQRIVEMINHLQNQQVKLQNHFKNIQEKEEMLDIKEKRLEGMQHQESIRIAEKHNEIISSQQKLEEEFQRLRQEKKSIILLQKEMEATHKQIIEVANYLGNSQMELDELQSLNIEHFKKQDTINGSSSHSTLNLAQSMRTMQENAAHVYQRAIDKFKEKNVKLQTLVHEQQSKINRLSVKVSSLSSQLEDATAALRILSTQDDNKSKMQPIERHLTFPISIVKEILEHVEHEGVYREEQSARNVGKSNEERIYRRPRSEEGSVCSTSPTEEILTEAKHRLQRLEMESDEVDRRYNKFKQKHLAEGFRIFPLKELPIADKNASRIKCSHEKEAHNTCENLRLITKVDEPIENHPARERKVFMNNTSNHGKFNENQNNLKKKSGKNLLNMNNSTQIKSLVDHNTSIALSNTDTMENDRESSPSICLVPIPNEQLSSEKEINEIQKEVSSQERNDRNLIEKNSLSGKLSDTFTLEDHQTELKRAENNPETKSESRINSMTSNYLHHIPGVSSNISTDKEKNNEKMEESNDSLTSSDAKLSVGGNGNKAEDSFW